MTEQDGQNATSSCFISYSRKDKDFVRKLNDSLDANGVDAWVDWEGIPLSSDWMDEITRAIDGGDAFLFVISPEFARIQSLYGRARAGFEKQQKTNTYSVS